MVGTAIVWKPLHSSSRRSQRSDVSEEDAPPPLVEVRTSCSSHQCCWLPASCCRQRMVTRGRSCNGAVAQPRAATQRWACTGGRKRLGSLHDRGAPCESDRREALGSPPCIFRSKTKLTRFGERAPWMYCVRAIGLFVFVFAFSFTEKGCNRYLYLPSQQGGNQRARLGPQ